MEYQMVTPRETLPLRFAKVAEEVIFAKRSKSLRIRTLIFCNLSAEKAWSR